MTIKYATLVPAVRTHHFTVSWGKIKHLLLKEIIDSKQFAQHVKDAEISTDRADMTVDGATDVPDNFSITVIIPEKT